MKFYIAEKEAFDELGASETLGDLIRIGFNRVDFINKDGKKFECWEMYNKDTVIGNCYEDGEYQTSRIDADTPIDQCTILIDRDEDDYTNIQVKELA